MPELPPINLPSANIDDEIVVVSTGWKLKRTSGDRRRFVRVAPPVVVTPVPPPTTSPLFGTLATDSTKAAQEFTAGLRIVGHETGWDRHEKSDGVFSQPDLDRLKAEHDAFLKAGLQLQLEPGLHYPPSYLAGLGRYVNQFGQAGGHPDMTWNANVRGRVERYIAKLATTLDLKTYAAIRVGAGGDVEALFPPHNAGGTSNGYWAYSPLAQANCPVPGLKPGQTSTRWSEWYSWYLGSLVGEIVWKMNLYRSHGFTGQFHVLMPGSGARPSTVGASINNRLTTNADVMARGAAWEAVTWLLQSEPGVVAYCSSAAEGANPDYTQPSDASKAVTDPALNSWSSMRWLTYLAQHYSLGIAGENPGNGDSTNYAGQMNVLVHQAKVGGWSSAFWAHDRNLYDGTGPTLAQYAAAVKTA